MCAVGDLESAPVLRRISSGGCVYELEWYTAAACVLSKTQGDNCKVRDPQAGGSLFYIGLFLYLYVISVTRFLYILILLN